MECANCQSEIPEDSDSCPRCGWRPPVEKIRFAQLKSIFSGRYDFLRLLGIGGFAEVYLARDILLEREVAVKILLPQHAQDPQTVERFLREARLYAKLEHPNIIPIYDTGILQQHVFITMKYIRGESLKHVLAYEKRVDAQLLLLIAGGVARALAYIHRQGIVHRDIKPANIIVEKATRTVYLADFGIARADSSQTITQTGMIVGTPHYLSPEQIQGRKIDSRSDIYALGATLYELACGQPPFHGDSPLEILYQHINERPEPLAKRVPGIDPVLNRLISKCTEKDPARRFQNAEEIIAIIEGMGNPKAIVEEKTVLTAAIPAQPVWAMKIFAGLTLLLAATIGAYFIWFNIAGPSPSVPAGGPAISLQHQDHEKNKPAGIGTREQPPAAVAQETASPLPGGQTGAKLDGGTGDHAGEQNNEKPSGLKRGSPLQAETRPSAKPAAKAAEPPPQLAGTVRFSSFPPLADVFFNGDKIGNTEQVFAKDFPPGDYSFVFTIPDYESLAVTVTAVAGKTVSAHHRFLPFRSFTVTARPFGRVRIDGREYGDTPQTVKLAYGEHLIAVSKEGYRSQERRLTIGEGEKNSVFFELEKEGIQ